MLTHSRMRSHLFGTALGNAKRLQRGTSLIEVMVSIILLSIGLIGSTQLVTSAIKEQSAMKYKIAAANAANELMERMRVNGLAVNYGLYVDTDASGVPLTTPNNYAQAAINVANGSVSKLGADFCNPTCLTPQDAATLDMARAQETLRARLPGVQPALSVQRVPPTSGATVFLPNARLVVVAWVEPVLNLTTGTGALSVDEVIAADGNNGCPTGFNTDKTLNVRCVQFRFQL